MTLNPLNMTGRRVIVTGAGSGIGKATAVLLSQLGASTVLVGRNTERLQNTRALITAGRSEIEHFDFTQADEIVDWLKSLAVRHGRIDGLVHSAGIQSFNPLRSISVKALERLFRVNTTSAAMLIKGMQLQEVGADSGSIVLISSTAAIKATPANGLYGMSKAALLSMVRTFSMELVSRRIRLNAVIPALVETEMVESVRNTMTADAFQALTDKHPMGIGQPLDVANAIAFLLSEASRWITGVAIPVDGGVSA
jgi:NAD(P)-dependent dehydrogenase (short-subunit alcohol dehydrogenase family)